MAAYRYTPEPEEPVERLRPRFRLRSRVAPGAEPGDPAPGSIIPSNSIAGTALMSVVAIMSFLACLTVGAVTLIRDAAADWQGEVGREVTIQIRPIEGVDLADAIARAIEIAEAAPGVASADPLPESENAKLLEPWLGADLDIGELPIPRLIVVSLSDPAAADLAALGARLRDEVRGASLDDHRAWADRLRTAAGATVLIGFSVLVLVFAATVLSVVFATRGAMAGNRDIVSVLHFVGAENGFIAGEFQRHFLVLGLKGGLAGAAAACAVFAILSLALPGPSSPEGAQLSALFGSFSIGPVGYFGALGVAFVIAILTAVTSRLVVHRYLAAVE
jgi:cell division transport system permease protein